MKKRICSLALCIILLIAIPMTAMAAQEANMIQKVWIDELNMTIICADTAEDSGEYQVQVDSMELPVQVSDLRSEQIPVTVFCLVDTSGSISQFKMKLIQETLTQIGDSMGRYDNMVIATLGNTLEVGSILNSYEERTDAIGAITATHEDTNLFGGIVQSLEKITSDTTYNDYCCLVVLSDGVEGQDNGMTEQEVLDAVDKARLPVFTVALVEDYSEREGGKVLGSFARRSHGGMHQTTANEGGDKPIRWDASGVEFGANIFEAIGNMAVLSVDLSELRLDGTKSEVRMDVTYTADGSAYSDSILLSAGDLPKPPVETEPETQPETEETTQPTEETEEEKPGSVWLWVGIIAAVLVIAGVVVLILVRRAKNKKAPEDYGMMTLEQDFELGVTRSQGDDDALVTAAADLFDDAPTQTLQQQYRVCLTDIPYGTQQVQFVVNAVELVTFGRDPKRAKCIVNAADTQLSGLHFSLTLQKNKYCIRDEGSKNGTFLNGVPISNGGWIKLHDGDKIRAGAYEYRITIEMAE